MNLGQQPTPSSSSVVTISNLLDRLNDDGDIGGGNDTTSTTLLTTSMPSMTLAENVTTSTDQPFYWIPFKFAYQERHKIVDQFNQLYNKIRANDTHVLILFGLGIAIALGGVIAILCQLHCWARSRRQRQRKERELRYDTERWLDYSFSREKLTPGEVSHLRKTSAQWQNCVSPLSYKESVRVDINRNITTSEANKEDKTKAKNKKRKSPKCLTKCLSSSTNHYDVKGERRKNAGKSKKNGGGGGMAQKLAKLHMLEMAQAKMMINSPYKNEMSMPLYYNSISSAGTTTTRSAVQPSTAMLSAAAAAMGSLQRREYETQTMAIDLMGSDDDDIANNNDNNNNNNIKSNHEAVYEKLQKPSRPVVGNVVYAKARKCASPKKHMAPQPPTATAVAMANNNSNNNVRPRQQVPPGVVVGGGSGVISSQFQASKFEGSNSSTTASYTTTSSTLAKNPLYNEPSDLEELIMFESLKKTKNCSNNFKHTAHYEQIKEKPVVYSTFIKPKK